MLALLCVLGYVDPYQTVPPRQQTPSVDMTPRIFPLNLELKKSARYDKKESSSPKDAWYSVNNLTGSASQIDYRSRRTLASVARRANNWDRCILRPIGCAKKF